VLTDPDPRLFTGGLRSQLDPDGSHDEATVRAALDAAAAADVLDALPKGLDDEVTERARSFSGGQRQRLALARALLTDAETLVLVEPTSAVDAHTEATIAARLRAQRAGRTTVVVTASPLLLDHADTVAFLADGRLVAEGTHRELLHADGMVGGAYRDTVTRGENA
jgi:ABC-type multidrug transport system fused ATPase/permease subunit